MSDFILREADHDEDDEIDNDEGNYVMTESDNEFIDDETEFDQNPFSYYNLTNVEKSYDDTMNECLENFNFNQEANNYISDDLPGDIDEFDNFENKIDKFVKELYFPGEQNENSFLFAVLYAIRYYLTEQLDKVEDDFFSSNSLTVYERLYAVKDKLKLDLKLSSFEDQCFIINHILNKSNLFLRVYEQKKKFRYITNT